MALRGLGTAAHTLLEAASGRSTAVAAGLVAVGAVAVGLILATAASARAPSLTYGTLDTWPAHAVAESASGVGNAMFELNWSFFEPTPGNVSGSYVSIMQYNLRSFQAAGQHITLGLGLQNPPSWVYGLPDSTYVDQNGTRSAEANFVYSQAVRTAAATYLSLVNQYLPFSSLWAIRLTSGGDGEMLYPSGGTYWAFDTAALTGQGLAAGMTPNPDPAWRPGTAGLSPAQIAQWVSWYVGGLDNVTSWQMRVLSRLGFTGYYETVTPGSGTRPDALTEEEAQNLPDGFTGVGAVWNLYYAQLPDKANVMAYQSSMADQSGGNDGCQASDTALPLTSPTMDSWSASRWIARIADQYGLAVGGENPGYNMPSHLDGFYRDTNGDGMMADALRQARSCGFTVFYWAHDVHLWDGTLPFSTYAAAISQ
jgi:hypothetical protein